MKRPPIANSYRDAWCGDLGSGDAGRQVRLAGWVHSRRDHGALLFVDLRDRSGLVQLVFDPERSPVYALASALHSEELISVSGTVLRRGEGKTNARISTGEIEIDVRELEVLASTPLPPFMIDVETHLDEATRLRYRYLDLRRASMRKALILRHELVSRIRGLLDERDFLEIETPILTRSTPEGARDFLVPSRINQGSWYALPQSPQIFKQLLMIGGYERYFQIARCFRDEDMRADRQPEFTQLDIEMSLVSESDVMALSEEVIAAVFEHAGFELPPPPWRHMAYDEAILRFGSDRPDTRFGLEISDVSEQLRDSQFKVFQSTLDNGGIIRALNAGARSLSRAELESLNDVVAPHRAKGVAPVMVGPDGVWELTIAKFFTTEHARAVNEILKASEGDLLLFVADTPEVAPAAIGALRIHLAERFGLIDGQPHDALWIIDFPMFGFDKRTRRWNPLHHPFTAPAMAGDPQAAVSFEDLGALRSRAYDLVVDGVEIGGGSIRIHQEQLQLDVLQALGMDGEEAQARFGFLLEALKYGAPPHGGIAFGVDRIVALCAGRDSIRDVIAFPKSTRGMDPLMGAPAHVAESQLRELGIVTPAETMT